MCVCAASERACVSAHLRVPMRDRHINTDNDLYVPGFYVVPDILYVKPHQC